MPDSTLAALTAATAATGGLLYGTQSGADRKFSLSAAGAAIAEAADAAAQIAALGLGTMATQDVATVAITGGTAVSLTGLAIRDTSAAYDITLAGVSTTPLTAGRTITLDVNNTAQTLKFTAASTVTFPAGTNTLACLANNTFTALQTITQASANAGILASTGYSLTGTDATSMVDLAGTWNTSGTPTAIKLNITNTASNAAALMMDLQIGGLSRFSIGKLGTISADAKDNDSVHQILSGGAAKFTYLGLGRSSLDFVLGVAGAPGQFFPGAIAGYGIFKGQTSSNMLLFGTASSRHAFVVDGNNNVILTGYLGFATSNTGVTGDAFLSRKAAAEIQMGADVNAAPVPQAFTAHSGITGTNIAGANFTRAGGTSTGTGRGGDLITKTANSGASGTTANSYTTRSYHSAKWVDLTESTATTFCNIAVAASKYMGCKLICTINSDDATDFQAITSELILGAVNKAGTVSATITQVDGTTAASAGTLTCTYTAVVNGNSVDIKANAVSSLTQTTLRAKWSIVSLNTDSTDTTVSTGSVVTPS